MTLALRFGPNKPNAIHQRQDGDYTIASKTPGTIARLSKWEERISLEVQECPLYSYLMVSITSVTCVQLQSGIEILNAN